MVYNELAVYYLGSVPVCDSTVCATMMKWSSLELLPLNCTYRGVYLRDLIQALNIKPKTIHIHMLIKQYMIHTKLVSVIVEQFSVLAKHLYSSKR